MTVSLALRGVMAADHPNLSPYVITAWQLPGKTARQALVPRLRGGTSFASADVGEAGQLTVEIAVLGFSTDDCEMKGNTWTAAWAESSVDLELIATIGTRSRIYRGRPQSCIPAVDGSDVSAFRCAFTTADPFWLDPAENWSTAAVGTLTGGFDSPIVSPIVTTSSGSTGDAAVLNQGTANAPWYALLFGPITNPVISLNGRSIQLVGDIPANSTLRIDGESHRVDLDGLMRPWAQFSSDWWDIPPGASTFSLRAQAGTGSGRLVWRDAYH